MADIENDLESHHKIQSVRPDERTENIKFYVLMVAVFVIGFVAFFGSTILTQVLSADPGYPPKNNTSTKEVLPTTASVINIPPSPPLTTLTPKEPSQVEASAKEKMEPATTNAEKKSTPQ